MLMNGSRYPFSFLLSGFSGKSINLYSYAANNPVILEDPRGRCVSLATVAAGGPFGALLGMVTNVAAYIATQRIANQKTTLGGMQVRHVIYKFFTLW